MDSRLGWLKIFYFVAFKIIILFKIIFIKIRGAVTGLLSYFTTLALTYISVADTRTIMAGYVIFVYFFGWLFLREQCGAMPIILSLIAFVI